MKTSSALRYYTTQFHKKVNKKADPTVVIKLILGKSIGPDEVIVGPDGSMIGPDGSTVARWDSLCCSDVGQGRR